MHQPSNYTRRFHVGREQSFIALTAFLLFSNVVLAQELPSAPLSPTLSPQIPTAMLFGPRRPPHPVLDAVNAPPSTEEPVAGRPRSTANTSNTAPGVRLITLEKAQQMAASANDPLVHLAQLQAEAAKEHRLGVEGMYFPNISSQFDNLHFNKEPGQVLTIQGPLGNQHSVAANIINKNQTVVNVAVVQPVTALFAIHQLVVIARADENIARAKAGMPVLATASNVEKNYFGLLVAERELTSAEAEARKIQSKWLTASNSEAPKISKEQEMDMIRAEKAVAVPASQVKELTVSLDEMLGLPEGTRLQLVTPEPLEEDVSLQDVAQTAAGANPEVVAAEQTAIKARAAAKLSVMEYFPNAAIIGGYAHQNAVNIIFPEQDAYIGAVATLTVFDGLKREHAVKEAKINAEAADLGVQLTKAKAAAGIKTSYLELQRSRQLAQLARRMVVSAGSIVDVSYQPDNPDVESARATMEADMFRAELEYRQAYARLKGLMGGK
jgi:outer membrane protein TolC